MFSNLSGRQGVSIFNRRRRPRQAVYASPQSEGVMTNLTTEVPDEQLVNMAQEFESGPGNYSFASNTNQNPSTHFIKTPTRPLQNRNLALHKHPNNQFNNTNTQVKVENHFSSGKTSCAYSSGQQQRMGAPQSWYSSNNSPNTQQKPSAKEFQFNRNPLNHQSPTQQFHQSQGQYSWNSPNNYSPANATTMSPGIARQPAENEKASFGKMQNQYKKVKMEKPVNENSKNGTNGETFTLKTVDKSMKFVTSTIQGVKKWSEHREQIPFVFEIFATLDSVPTSNNNGTAKFFNIKDTSGTIRSVYWEMDQKLPRVARGQSYRLTGALDRKTGQFQCFTIRQAQLSEQRAAMQQVALCDNALSKVVSMIAEA